MNNKDVKKKYFLSELMQIYKDKIEIKTGVINGVFAPCGSGKTTWALEEYLKEDEVFSSNLHKVLYITDTTMLKDFMQNKYSDKIKISDGSIFKDAKLSNFKNKFDPDKNKIIVMTYASFGKAIRLHGVKEILKKYFNLIYMDEFHNLFKYYDRYDKGFQTSKKIKPYANIIKFLPSLCRYTKIIGMTATPYRVNESESIKNCLVDTLGIHKKELKKYKTNTTCKYHYIQNIVKYLFYKDTKKRFGKILVYTKKITVMNELKDLFELRGFKTECLWSIGNKNKMTDEQLKLREYIIENQILPEDLEVLIINGAYETGWDLKDNNVQAVLIDSNNFDEITQVRNRIRCDIKTLCRRYTTKELEKGENNSKEFEILVLNKKYYNVPITEEMKKEMVYKYGVITSDRKNNWKNFKDIINEQGKFKIERDKTRLYRLTRTKSKELNNKEKVVIKDMNTDINKAEYNKLNKYLKSIVGKKLLKEHQEELINKINYRVQWKLMKSYNKLNEALVLLELPYIIIPKKSHGIRYWLLTEIDI